MEAGSEVKRLKGSGGQEGSAQVVLGGLDAMFGFDAEEHFHSLTLASTSEICIAMNI